MKTKENEERHRKTTYINSRYNFVIVQRAKIGRIASPNTYCKNYVKVRKSGRLSIFQPKKIIIINTINDEAVGKMTNISPASSSR